MPPTLIDALRDLLPAARSVCGEAPAARVVGEKVTVRSVELHEGPAPGLVAEVVRRGVPHRISLADVAAEEGTPFAEVVARYRELCGWGARGTGRAGPAGGGQPLAAGDVAEVAILSVNQNAARCRPVGSGVTVTLRMGDLHELIPGEIVRLRVRKAWRHAGHPYASGDVEATTLDVARLGLVPLRLEPRGDWDPEEEYWGEEGEPLPSWAAPIVAKGVRPAFEMEQVIPDADPNDWDGDPILDAVELNEGGDPAAARALLMKQLEQDLRCLDAHSHLGNWLMDHWTGLALRQYAAGVRIGELSLPPGFDGVLPWGYLDNRPFLRCLHGYGLALWRLGRAPEAAEVFERMLWLNPSDNQGARFLVAQVKAGLTWEEAEARGAAEATRVRTPYDPPSASRSAVPVDMASLVFAMDDHEPGHAWYLDLESGELVPDLGDLGDDDPEFPREYLEDESRFLRVEPRSSREAWGDMAEFVETVGDRALRQRLADAIEGEGAFGRFKRVLESAPAERERWFEWEAERLREEALVWLSGQGIVVVPRGAVQK